MSDSSKYLSSSSQESLPPSAFDEIDVPKIYDTLGLEYEEYILEDAGRASTIDWVIQKLDEKKQQREQDGKRGIYVVDLGCASGRPTVETIAKSLSQKPSSTDSSNFSDDKEAVTAVVGVDVSPVQIELARRRVGASYPAVARFEQGDMRTWSPEQQYSDGCVDAVLSHYALNHLPLEDFRQVVGRMVSWLRSGGVLALGTLAHVNGRVKWLGFDVVGSSLSLSEIVQLVEGLGCKVERSWEEEWKSRTREESKPKVNQFVLAVKE